MNINALIADFLNFLQTQKRQSPHTLKAYSHDLSLLQRLIFEKNPNLTVEKLDSLLIRQALSTLRRQNLNPRSIARILSAWRGFFRYLLLQKIISTNPTTGLHAPKKAQHLPHVLSVDETMTLLDFHHTNPQEWVTLRDQAMFELLYSTGIRLAELHALNVDSAQSALQQGSIRVLGKRQKMRDIPVGKKAVEALRKWLVVRNQLAKSHEVALFLNKKGTRLGYWSIAQRLDIYAREALQQHVHPHMLRHSFASHILQSSGNLRAVQELLGHASLSSTQVYTHLDFQHLAQIYDHAHPRAHRNKNE